ncbi:MAG: hypothetical protein EBU06_06950 [Micrococcales bacterium]|nr:hypothetical protein [Micrococcales bacterium]NBR62439.1 hypothetical protein [Actinomycetota bacterium]NBT48472.1 hypothetical protein [Actinomycetota bacterium]NBY43185.1 hypothetical protein [Micrococcales bacterium]
MYIQRGKIAILLVVLMMVVPGIFITALNIRERAMNTCTATPTPEPDSKVTMDFSRSPLGWVCHKTLIDETGEPIGATVDTIIPLIP